MENREQAFMERFNASVADFSYSRGYVQADKNIFVKCKRCGLEVERSGGFLRKVIRGERSIVCLNCDDTNNLHRYENKPIEKSCKHCDKKFTGSRSTFYCSDTCRTKNRNRRIENKRRLKRVEHYTVDAFDSSINIEVLIAKDNGCCHICGNQCDVNDYYLDHNGYFIVGKDYPSIDHVVPITKGGTHTWGNVKLAHHHCNLLKSNHIPPFEKLQMETL